MISTSLCLFSLSNISDVPHHALLERISQLGLVLNGWSAIGDCCLAATRLMEWDAKFISAIVLSVLVSYDAAPHSQQHLQVAC